MHRSLKVLLPVLALVALGVLGLVTTNCGSSQAQVRFVDAIWDAAGPLDIYFNGSKDFPEIGQFGHLPSTGYTAVPAGGETIEGYAAGGTTTEAFLSQNQVNLTAGTQYTLVATGNIVTTSNAVILAQADDNTEPAVGNVIFRFIDASPDQGTVYVYLIANPVVGNGCTQGTETTLAYQQTSISGLLPYNSSGGYTLYVCNAIGGNPLFTSTNLGLIGGPSLGSIRTIILTDNSQGTGMSQQIIPLADLN